MSKLSRTHRKDTDMIQSVFTRIKVKQYVRRNDMTFEMIKIMLDQAEMDGSIRGYWTTSVNGQDIFYVDDNDGNQRVVKVGE